MSTPGHPKGEDQQAQPTSPPASALRLCRSTAADWLAQAHPLAGLGYGDCPAANAPLMAGLHMRPLADPGGLIDGFSGGPNAQAGQHGQVRWQTDGDWLFGSVDSSVDAARGDLTDLSRQIYQDIFDTLAHSGIPHLLRVWNYLPDINREHAGLERYRQFNLGRQDAFLAAEQDAFAGSPAACALGTHGGPMAVRFLAGKVVPVPLENPRQVPAWRYPRDFGPRSPTFSRAVLVPNAAHQLTLFISGTASIVGHSTVHAGDVLAQTEETLRNLQAMLDTAQARSTAHWRLQDLVCTVYVRHAQDLPLIRPCFEAQVGPDSLAARSAIYLEADICRADLLVEIEAHAVAPGRLNP